MVARRVTSGLPIDFVAAGGRGLGLGHIVRSARLAREAHARGWSVRGFVDGDAVARRVFRETSGFEALPFDARFERFAALVALDVPTDKTSLLEHLGALGCRPLVIDDERPYAIPAQAPRGWRILPGLHHSSCETSGATDAQGFALLSGPRFAILAEAHRRFSAPATEERDSVLVTLGGSDPHRAGPVVARAARQAVGERQASDSGADPVHVDVVFGPSFEDPDGREAEALRDAGCRVHHGLDAPAMAARLRAARLALVGFGTTINELAWHATPFLTITHHDSDRGPARDLEARGFGRHLGAARGLERLPLVARIDEALRDTGWQQRSTARARRALGDGSGAARLFERIETELALHAPRPRLHPAENPPRPR